MPRARAGTIYQFDDLEVGGPPIVAPIEKRGSLESCAWRAAQRLNRGRRKSKRVIFTVRAFEQEGQAMVGCWRKQ